MLDSVLLVCAVIAIVGTAVRIGIAASVPAIRRRRIEWDDPTEAEG
ncbi:hypothetical protein MKK69_26055 [Methylobacterium sp. J-026]|nr:hypothetical protein [Methylobacterium sp. J-026]MCJ2137465.1 hypothetical protein [Methylobacterium sp. J-026]